MKNIFIKTLQWLVITFLFSLIIPAFALIIWCITLGGFSLVEAFHDPTFMAIEGFFAFIAMIGASIYVEEELE